MVTVINVGDIVFGKRLEAWDWARRMAGCWGGAVKVLTPVSGETDKVMFVHTCESLTAYDEQIKKPNPKNDALLKENREKHLLEHNKRFIYEELK